MAASAFFESWVHYFQSQKRVRPMFVEVLTYLKKNLVISSNEFLKIKTAVYQRL